MNCAPTARAIAACAVFATSAASANTAPFLPDTGLTLWQILDSNGPYNGSFQVFDKEFDVTSFGGNNALADLLIFKPVVFADPLDGVGFDITTNITFGGDDDDLAGLGIATSDLAFDLHYTVTVLEPGFAIKDALLGLKATSTGGDDDIRAGGLISVTENYTGTGVSDSLMVQNGADGNPEIATAYFDPVQSLDVSKHVSLTGFGGDDDLISGDDGTTVHIEYIRQTFSQIPAPGTAGVFGALGLLAARRRR